jgi:hypothetical protein
VFGQSHFGPNKCGQRLGLSVQTGLGYIVHMGLGFGSWLANKVELGLMTGRSVKQKFVTAML